MTNNNNYLRGLEIRFYLTTIDLENITNPPNTQNIFAFFEFMEKIDFTKSVDYDILKTLITKIHTENTNIQPNKIELCNFIHTHNIPLAATQKYIRISAMTYAGIIERISSETFYQPIHLQDKVYKTIENFLNQIQPLLQLGVEKYVRPISRK